MKICNLLEDLNKTEKVLISETKIINGKNIDEKRIVLFRGNKKPVLLSESIYNFHKFRDLIGTELEVELNPTNITESTVSEGTLKYVSCYLEEML